MNQTIYFLRRVIDPDYSGGRSSEYVHFEGEAVWLDPALVSVDSHMIRHLLRDSAVAKTDRIARVLDLYRDKFATEFTYEDWTVTYRDALHASVLAAAEDGIATYVSQGDSAVAIEVCRQLLAIDPTADGLELTLLRLYRQTGAPAAAAEQYAHYATVLRNELGVDPPAFEDLVGSGGDT